VAGEAHAHRVADGEVAQRVRVHVHACLLLVGSRLLFPPLRETRARRARDRGFRRRCKEWRLASVCALCFSP
jgi:hypothetical protein